MHNYFVERVLCLLKMQLVRLGARRTKTKVHKKYTTYWLLPTVSAVPKGSGTRTVPAHNVDSLAPNIIGLLNSTYDRSNGGCAKQSRGWCSA